MLISLAHGLFETRRRGLNMLNWNKKTGKVPHQKTKLGYPVQKLEHTTAATVNLAFNLDFNNLSNMNWCPQGAYPISPIGHAIAYAALW